MSIKTITSTTYLNSDVHTVIINSVNPTINIFLPEITDDTKQILFKRIDNTDNLVFIIGHRTDKINKKSSYIFDKNKTVSFHYQNKKKNWKINNH